MSAALDKNQASGSSQPTMDIPVVNIPDYPDRTPRRGPMKSIGTIVQQQKQGLTAPMTADVSSSGPKMQQISPTTIVLFMISPPRSYLLFHNNLLN